MKIKSFLLILTVFFSIISFAQEQDEIESIVLQGIAAHDNGEFEKAIDIYKKALLLDSLNPLVNYEIALSYYSLQDFQKAIDYSDIVLKEDNDLHFYAYTIKGSALSDLEQLEDALKTFNQSLQIDSIHYLNHFNISLIHIKMKNRNKAEESLIKALQDNPFHGSSHYYLTMNSINTKRKIPALLSAYFFLLLEPNSNRAEEILNIIHYLNTENISKDEENTINIVFNQQEEDSLFRAAELFLSLFMVNKYANEESKNAEEDVFCTSTESLFLILSELKEKEIDRNFWHDFYISFYEKLANSDYMYFFCDYISLSQNENKEKWYDENEEQIKKFIAWIENIFN